MLFKYSCTLSQSGTYSLYCLPWLAGEMWSSLHSGGLHLFFGGHNIVCSIGCFFLGFFFYINVQNSNNRLLLQRHLCTVAGNGGLFFISENATIPVNRWERWCTALWRTEMVPIWLHFTSKVSPFIYSIISIMTLQKYFGILAFLSSWWFWLIFLRKALLSCYISRRVWFSCLIFCQSPGNHSMWW